MNKTKKSLWASGLSLLVCIALLIGTTFAWFTDSVTNKGNKIQAGTLKVQLWNGEENIGDSEEPVFNYEKWEPGYSTGANLYVKNVGTLAIEYELELQNVVTTKGIENVIDVLVDGTKVGVLADFMDGTKNLDEGMLEAGESSASKAITLKMQETAGNTYQEATATFDILLKAKQAVSETDGFGNNDYDEDALYDYTEVTTEEDLVEAIEAGEPVKLMEDVTIDTVTLPLSENGKTNIDLNEKTLTANVERAAIVEDGQSLSIQNGTLEADLEGQQTTVSAICVGENGTLNLDGVTLTTENSAILPQGNNATVNIKDSRITAGVYGVSTNAGSADNYPVNINIVNSTIASTSADSDNCPVLINVPGKLYMENCTVKGQRQAVVVRGGDATLKNCTLETKGTYASKGLYLDGNWGSGNEVPMATLVVGNRSASAYQYSATCTLLGTTLVKAPEGVNDVYMWGNSGEGLGATLRYDAASTVHDIVEGDNTVVEEI